jgi:hypothetical protein
VNRTVSGKRTNTNTLTCNTIAIHTTTLLVITGGIMGTGTDITTGIGTGGAGRITTITTTGAGQVSATIAIGYPKQPGRLDIDVKLVSQEATAKFPYVLQRVIKTKIAQSTPDARVFQLVWSVLLRTNALAKKTVPTNAYSELAVVQKIVTQGVVQVRV